MSPVSRSSSLKLFMSPESQEGFLSLDRRPPWWAAAQYLLMLQMGVPSHHGGRLLARGRRRFRLAAGAPGTVQGCFRTGMAERRRVLLLYYGYRLCRFGIYRLYMLLSASPSLKSWEGHQDHTGQFAT